MLKRLYAHSFRRLQNFDLTLDGMQLVLLLGQNGAGKMTIGRAVEILQSITRGSPA